eukprot:gnl/Hemi2/4413_TR1545_c0_g9_i1.p1 gnl/Hemi2/4413_TR1545_c0_g9~~gnl/Hemi2/4413_TR1545_c0_g9_i1.p1  ORF type:complete len:868 (-),score=180.07 gnl/Hemi2/4413_TR1545_c0_g9_i1:117-2720(-)
MSQLNVIDAVYPHLLEQENLSPNTSPIGTHLARSVTPGKTSISAPPSPAANRSSSKTLPRSFTSKNRASTINSSMSSLPPMGDMFSPRAHRASSINGLSTPPAHKSSTPKHARAPSRDRELSQSVTSLPGTPHSSRAARALAEENVKVVCRCRPMNEKERRDAQMVGLENLVACDSENNEVSVYNQTKTKVRTFRFDKVYDEQSSQEEVFDNSVKPIVEQVLEGFNCTIFAYGQTGTGKTFTMEGPNASNSEEKFKGVIPRAVEMIFNYVNTHREDATIRVSYLELYNEELSDLISCEQRKAIRVLEDHRGSRNNERGNTNVQGLEEFVVHSLDDITKLMERAWKKRKTAETFLNTRSSRSHAIFTVIIQTREAIADGEDLIKTGKLNLVDLAGSENIGRSGAVKERATEAGHINTSLLTLGRVISALVEGAPHIPYRDSKLTRILQESLGGRAQTCIIATISPAVSHLDETLSTLDYAHRAKNIRNRPEINQKISKSQLIREYLLEIESLKQELNATRARNGIFLPQERYDQLENDVVAHQETISELKLNLNRRESEILSLTTHCNAMLENTKAFSQHEKDRLDQVLQLFSERDGVAKNSLEDCVEKAKFAIDNILTHLNGTMREWQTVCADLQSDLSQINTAADDHLSQLEVVQEQCSGARNTQVAFLHKQSAALEDMLTQQQQLEQANHAELMAQISSLISSRLQEHSQKQRERMISYVDGLRNTIKQRIVGMEQWGDATGELLQDASQRIIEVGKLTKQAECNSQLLHGGLEKWNLQTGLQKEEFFEEAFDSTQFEELIDQFPQNATSLTSAMTSNSHTLTTMLQAGACALKTDPDFCPSDADTKNPNCPVCTPKFSLANGEY